MYGNIVNHPSFGLQVLFDFWGIFLRTVLIELSNCRVQLWCFRRRVVFAVDADWSQLDWDKPIDLSNNNFLVCWQQVAPQTEAEKTGKQNECVFTCRSVLKIGKRIEITPSVRIFSASTKWRSPRSLMRLRPHQMGLLRKVISPPHVPHMSFIPQHLQLARVTIPNNMKRKF